MVALIAASSLSGVQARDGTQTQKQDSTDTQAAQLKLIKSPMAPDPEEARKKNVKGKVILRIVVDAQVTPHLPLLRKMFYRSCRVG